MDQVGYRSKLTATWEGGPRWEEAVPEARAAIISRMRRAARDQRRLLLNKEPFFTDHNGEAAVMVWETVLDPDIATDDDWHSAGIQWEAGT